MSQENVEIVQRAMAAYMGGDEVTVRQLVTPDVLRASTSRSARIPLQRRDSS